MLHSLKLLPLLFNIYMESTCVRPSVGLGSSIITMPIIPIVHLDSDFSGSAVDVLTQGLEAVWVWIRENRSSGLCLFGSS